MEENPPDMILILINYLYENKVSVVIRQLFGEMGFSQNDIQDLRISNLKLCVRVRARK